MSVTIVLQDIINQVSDYNQNYTTSTIDQGNVIRAINRAIEFVQRRLGLPSDRKVQSFYFYEDTRFYDCIDGFTEFVQLYYNTTAVTVDMDKNSPINRWNVVEDTEIFRSTGFFQNKNRVAFTTINGKNQLLLDGFNIHGKVLVNSFDILNGLTFSSSITGAAVDGNIFKQGSASIVFNVNNSESASTVTITPVQFDIRNLLNTNGAYRMYVYFPTGVSTTYLTNIELQLISSAGNYYTMNTTVDYLGNAWASNGWSLLSWLLTNATTVGSPDASSITSIKIILNHAGGFVNFTNMRFDYLYQIQPDYLDHVYYSAFKGTDSAGTTNKVLLSLVSDKLSFASYAPDLIGPIALKAATLLWPQLRADKEFMAVYKQDFTETMLLFGKSYPKKRNSTAASTSILR